MASSHYSKYCNDKLLSTFPELLDNLGYKFFIKDDLQKPDGAHGIYKYVFSHFVLDLIKKSDKESQEKIKVAFHLIEDLANHECPDIRNVVEASFFKPFVEQVKSMRGVKKYLGVKSLAMAQKFSHVFKYSKYCNKKLFSTFPELIKNLDYKKSIEHALETGSTSAHDIYEDVFCSFVLNLIQKSDSESDDKIKNAFDLIEEIANHKDFNVRNVAYVSFIEPFLFKIRPMKDAEKYLGKKSLEMAREIARTVFERDPNTWEGDELPDGRLDLDILRMNALKKEFMRKTLNHFTKCKEGLTKFHRILSDPHETISRSDRKTAERVMSDLRNAIDLAKGGNKATAHYSQYCNDKLLSTFPELLDNLDYRKIIKDKFQTPKHCAHGIYEEVFCPFVLNLIQKSDKESQEKIKAAFHLIEDLANHECPDMRNVAEESFIQPFVEQVKSMRGVKKYLGVKSLAMAREIARAFQYSQYCNEKLLTTFPELLDHLDYREIIEDALERGGTSAHSVYEGAFFPFVLNLIQKPGKKNDEKLKLAFHLVEEIITHENGDVRCIAYASFIEPFTAAIEPMKDVEKYLGRESLEVARQIAHKQYGRNPNTWEKE